MNLPILRGAKPADILVFRKKYNLVPSEEG